MDINTGLLIAGGVVIAGVGIYYIIKGRAEAQPCTEGERRCNGTTLEECQNGEWVPIESNSPECGYVPPPSYYVKGFLKDDTTGEPIVGAVAILVELGIEVRSATSGFFIFDIDPITKEPFDEVPEGTYTLQITPRFPDDHEPVTLKVVVPGGANVGTIEMHSPSYEPPPPPPPPGEVYIDDVYYQKKGDSNWYPWEDGLAFEFGDLFINSSGYYRIKVKVASVNKTGQGVLAQVDYQVSGPTIQKPYGSSGTGRGGKTPIDWQLKNRASQNIMGETKTFSFQAGWGEDIVKGAHVFKVRLDDWANDKMLDSRTYNFELA